jgi:hypothetical protein
MSCPRPQKLDEKVKEYEVERHALFFTDADSKRIYKENVKYTVLRKNSVNGRVYKDDPTIFAWGLLNEPRCETWKVGPHPCAPLRLTVPKSVDGLQNVGGCSVRLSVCELRMRRRSVTALSISGPGWMRWPHM